MSTRLEPRDPGEALEKLLIEEERLKKMVESYQIQIHDLETLEKNQKATIAFLNSQLREQQRRSVMTKTSVTDNSHKRFSVSVSSSSSSNKNTIQMMT